MSISNGRRVIIFGINNTLREKIERWLNEDVIIVGYADYGKVFRLCRQFAYQTFFSMDDLREKDNEYDYITQTSHLNKCLCTLKIQ